MLMWCRLADAISCCENCVSDSKACAREDARLHLSHMFREVVAIEPCIMGHSTHISTCQHNIRKTDRCAGKFCDVFEIWCRKLFPVPSSKVLCWWHPRSRNHPTDLEPRWQNGTWTVVRAPLTASCPQNDTPNCDL